MPKISSVLAIVCLSATGAFADISITVIPSLAPNGWGSASFPGWQSNAVDALMHGLTANGDPTKPTYYQTISTIPQNDVLVTSFPSWLGETNPGGVFGAAFANEYGNRVHFGLVIDGHGSQFSISQLSFTAHSTDPFDGLGFSFPSGFNYGPGYVGVQKGSDGLLGTPDDVLITGGPSTVLVDALYGRGSGNAYWPCGPGDPAPCSTAAEKQAALDATAAYNFPDSYQFIGEYSLTGTSASGAAQVTIVPTPEPFSLGLLATVLGGVAFRLRKRRA